MKIVADGEKEDAGREDYQLGQVPWGGGGEKIAYGSIVTKQRTRRLTKEEDF